MLHSKLFLLFTVAALLVPSGSSLAATPVTTCGEVVTDGVLTADLDCSTAEFFALVLEDEGVLDLAGFTLTGTPTAGGHWDNPVIGGGVRCLGRCTILGNGGTIASPAGLPEKTYYSFGVYADPDDRSTSVTISDATITGWTGAAVQGARLVITGSTFTDNQFAVLGRKKSTVDGSTFTGNAQHAIHTYHVNVSNSSITGNGGGIYGLRKVRTFNTIVENNDYTGFTGLKLIAEDSSFNDNCTNSPVSPCVDLMAVYGPRPRLRNSTCGTSLRREDGETWGICSLD